MEPVKLPRVIFLMGPTASGKTALAVELARRLDGEVISVDSALVFRGMDIGTAKPNLDERGGISHHLIDILDPSEAFSTGQFRDRALSLMADIEARGRVPILAGGTMLYFNALLHGLAELPPANPDIRRQLDLELARDGKTALHRRLQAVDPAAAARIHPNDPQRIQRALEVFQISGKPISSYFDQPEQALPFRPIRLIIAPQDRRLLHEKIALRFHVMLVQGLVEEVEALFRRGDLDESMPSVRAVGYRQVWSYLRGDIDYETMTEKAIVATRQLAKRQFTWLRREEGALRLVTGEKRLLDKALEFIDG